MKGNFMKKSLLIVACILSLGACSEKTNEQKYHELESKLDYTPYYINGEVFVGKEETKLAENDTELIYRVDLILKETEYDYYCTSSVINRYIVSENKIETSWLY